MSYFAKPNFIIYDEWFDDDFKKTKFEFKEKKVKTISNIHEFFYEKSNYKVGGSENNLQLKEKINQKKLSTNNYLKNTSEKNPSGSNKKFSFSKKLTIINPKFNFTKKIIYTLLILGITFIFGSLLFFISESKKNELNILNKSFLLEKKF